MEELKLVHATTENGLPGHIDHIIVPSAREMAEKINEIIKEINKNADKN